MLLQNVPGYPSLLAQPQIFAIEGRKDLGRNEQEQKQRLPACLCENTCLIQNRSDEESWSPQKLLVYAPSIAVFVEPREQRDRSKRSRPVLLESLPSLTKAYRPSGKHPVTVGYLLYPTTFLLM